MLELVFYHNEARANAQQNLVNLPVDQLSVAAPWG